MSEVYAFVSGRGGTGKSALAAESGVLLARNKRVLAIDLSIGMRSLDQFLGYADKVVYDIMDISDARIRSRHVILSQEERSWPSLIPASQTRSIDEIDISRVDALIRQLREKYDCILLDLPAGRTPGWTAACQACDRILITETPDASGIRGIDRMRCLIDADFPDLPVSLILNRYIPGAVNEGWQTAPEEICELTGLSLAGWIPEDRAFSAGIVTGAADLPDRLPAVEALNNVLRRLNGEEIPISDPSALPLPYSGSHGLLQRLFRSH